MRRRLIFLSFLYVLTGFSLQAQVTFPVNGTTDPRHTTFAFTNAKLFIDYRTIVDSGVLIVRDGIVLDAGKGIAVPKDAVVYDVSGRTIYPSLIDIFSDYGLASVNKTVQNDAVQPQFLSGTKGAYSWNQAVRAEYDAFRNFSAGAKESAELRKLGFGTVSSLNRDGVVRGTSVLALLGEGKENDLILKNQSAAQYSFDKGSSTQDYPSSLMGSIALIRQNFYDAAWYAAGGSKKETNITLDAMNQLKNLPQIFDAGDKLNVLRVAAIGKEFNTRFIVKTSGNEYQRLQEIKEAGLPLIVSLNFPEAYDLTDPEEALNISIAPLKHWELAPANPAFLSRDSIPFAITAADLKKKDDFWKNLRKAVSYGLSEEAALKALTYTPASLLGVEKVVGSLSKGMVANFVITTQNLFSKDNVILENWVKGNRYVIREYARPEIRGTYALTFAGTPPLQMTVSGDAVTPDIFILEDTSKVKVSYTRQANQIRFSFESKKTKQSYRMTGEILDAATWEGKASLSDGESINWKAQMTKAWLPEAKTDTAKRDTLLLGKVMFPFNAFGWTEKPVAKKVLFRNATVWTGEKEGILQNTDVLISNGKIQQVGKNMATGDAEVVDATGKYLTAGIIDEHSHIAASGSVNEGTQSSSAEVRIGDIIDCDDVDIYRQLGGGVTTSHILHGSANAIGGQTQLIKLRWGSPPGKLKFETDGSGGPAFIKFALGENVKQSHWGDKQVYRFPQTRMGVEQVYKDYFTRAREYDTAWKKYNSRNSKSPQQAAPRKDLELDALAEILNKKRFITCHSYVQSEINMLMHVADSFGFTVNTFTHILEGYKVADKMKKHGAGASSFSDWWAYKYEVYEAIPYNGAIMYGAGLTVAYNSDDGEQARRLNQEAAKAVKYGGVPEEEAWKFVTLNPAKLLHIEHRTGSIAAGKDADVVLWDNNPLSVYAKVLQTYVDGIKYFDTGSDRRMREEIRRERARLVLKMGEAKRKGEATQPPLVKYSTSKHCLEEDHYFLHSDN